MLEDGRRDREIAFRREPVRDLADVRVDAKDFLDDHNAAARIAGRIGAPGPNLPGSLRLHFDPGAHADLGPFDCQSPHMGARASLRNGDPADDQQ